MGISWISRKGGILEKGGGYEPPYQLCVFVSRETNQITGTSAPLCEEVPNCYVCIVECNPCLSLLRKELLNLQDSFYSQYHKMTFPF